MDNYLKIMIDSLVKKSEYLRDIIEKNNLQEKCIQGKDYDEIDWDAFNLLVTEKEILIDRINTMDEGFQSLYDRIKEQITDNKDKYKDEIATIQNLIRTVTDQSVEITTGEERNRRQIEKIMGARKKVIRGKRNSLKVAQSYYQSMRGHATEDLSMMDKKK